MTKKTYGTWERVHGPDLQPQHGERAKLNEAMMKNPVFISACEKAGIPATKRQASKFRRKFGIAYKGERN